MPRREDSIRKKLLRFNGKTQTLAAWAKELGISEELVRKRLQRGRTVDEALTAPLRAARG